MDEDRSGRARRGAARRTIRGERRGEGGLRAPGDAGGRAYCCAPGTHASGRAGRRPGSGGRRLARPCVGAAGGDAGPGREHARPARAPRSRPCGSDPVRREADRRRDRGHRLLRQHAPCGCEDPGEEDGLHAPGLRCRRPAGGPGRLWLRRQEPGSHDRAEPRRLRGELRPAPPGGEGAGPDLPGRAVSDARLDARRFVPQQSRLHPRRLDRAPSDLRASRRRGPASDPLRPVPRDPHGSGHARDLPVPEGRGICVPDRRLPREGAGRRSEGAGRLGVRRADLRAR